MNEQKNTRTPRVSKYKGKAKKVLTVPLLKLNAGDCIAFEFTGEHKKMFLGKPTKDGKVKDPVTGMTYDKEAAEGSHDHRERLRAKG